MVKPYNKTRPHTTIDLGQHTQTCFIHWNAGTNWQQHVHISHSMQYIEVNGKRGAYKSKSQGIYKHDKV